MAREGARMFLWLSLAESIILTVIGACAIDRAINAAYKISDGGNGLVSFMDWTVASGFAHVFATMAGLVCAAAALPGLYHVRAWNQVTFPAAAYYGFMAWLLTLLALGLDIKDVILGGTVHQYKQLGWTKVLLSGDKDWEWAAIRVLLLGCLAETQLCYLIAIFDIQT